jgi:hypothetical protein
MRRKLWNPPESLGYECVRGRSTRRRAIVRFLVAWLAPFIALTARTAWAAHPEVVLRYERDEGAEVCPGADDLRAAVAARLGYDPFAEARELDTLTVRIRRVGSGLEGTLERRDSSKRPRGTPTTITSKSGDCAELAASLAVGIAIAVDPLSILQAAPVPAAAVSAPRAQPLPPPVATAPAVVAPEAPVPRGAPVLLHVGAGPSLAVDALPSPSFGARAFFGVSRGIFELDLEGQFYAPTSQQGPGGSVEASLLLGTLAPCLRYWLVVGCVDLSLGQLQGTGNGFGHPHDGDTFYAAAGVRGGLEIPLGRTFALRLMVEGQAPLRPTQLDASGSPIWTTPAFAFLATPMVVVHFL